MDEVMKINTIYYIPSKKNRILNMTVRLTMWMLRDTVNNFSYRSIKYDLKYIDGDNSDEGGKFVCYQMDGSLISQKAKFISNCDILSNMLGSIDKKNDEISRQILWDNYQDTLPSQYWKTALEKSTGSREEGSAVRYSINTCSEIFPINIDDIIDVPEPKEMPKPAVEPPPMTLLSKETLDAKEARRVAEELKAVIEERQKTSAWTAVWLKSISERLIIARHSSLIRVANV